MPREFTLAVTGDTIINRRLSVYTDERFLSLIKILRDADVAFTHLEGVIHDYEGPEVYPAAEGGGTWMRSPRFAAQELKWAGFDMVSHASNHSMDYSYGGLMSTWKALDEAGLPHAGTGMNLGEAREPAYLETDRGRVALISACSSFARWGRAGEARSDVKGRPGINPLRFYRVVNASTLQMIKELAVKLGYYVLQNGKQLLVNPAGTHNTFDIYVQGGGPESVILAADEEDVEGNLRSVREARRQADWVLMHLHTHEFEGALSQPANFVQPFAHACIDAGADVFIGEGSHAPLRGIELYKGKPVFYDPGDFIFMSNTVTRLPADFYSSPMNASALRGNQQATPAEAFDSRVAAKKAWQRLSPTAAYPGTGIGGCVVAVCTFGEGKQLTGLKLHPVSIVGGGFGEPRPSSGLPMPADAKKSKEIIECLAELSTPFGTNIDFKDGMGIVKT